MTQRSILCRFAPALAAGLLCATPAWAQVRIDGHIEPGEWAGAHEVTDFRQSMPLTGKPAKYPVEAWIEALPQGLAIAVRVSQPPGVTRTEQKVQRDFRDNVDRVNINVDFNGDGRVGYNFAVASTGAIDDEIITNESKFDSDWDGKWKHAVSQDADGWSVEVLIPWSIAPMRAGVDGKRTIGINIDRVIASIGSRVSWPVVNYSQPRYLSDFVHLTIPAYSQSLLAITPYASAVYDNVAHANRLRGGVDVFWKPNGQFQLTATINPGFGQVESDDLVVNFSATETYFSDKRPFFTENEGIFNFSIPGQGDGFNDNNQLLYTRRVGGPSDDGGGVSNINAALKLNGSLGATHYGVLAADERGQAGRTFGALRLVHDFGDQRLGMLLTHVDRPWLDRDATVLGIDHHWQPDANVTLWTNVIGSDIRQAGTGIRGAGATVKADYLMDHGWRQEWTLLHFDDRLQIDDFGFLARNNLDYAAWTVSKRDTDLPDGSIYSSHEWQVQVAGADNDNRHLRLSRQLAISRDSNLRNGSNENLSLTIGSAAWDDLLTRGHGALFLPPAAELAYRFTTPRQGNWQFEVDAGVSGSGLSGNGKPGWELAVTPTYYLTNAFRFHVGLDYKHVPDWLVWQHDALIGRFDQHQLELDAGFDWSMGERQELRLKLQAIGLDARARDAWIVGPAGRAVASVIPVDDFSVRNLGVQLRYRYELAPLSYLYVVYGRGGYLQTPESRTSTDLLSRSLGLRQGEQVLVKINYRFDR